MSSLCRRRNRFVQTPIAGAAALACLFPLTGPVSAQPCSPEEITKLLASDGATLDNFGVSVSISGDTAVIGARRDDDNGTDSGSAYVYRFDGVDWVQETKLLAADGAAGDGFGYSVSVAGNTAVIGTPFDDDNGNLSGAAYIFRFDGSSWAQKAKLLAADGTQDDEFGLSVSISSDIAVIGAPYVDDNGFNAGSSYVFRFDGAGWTQEAKLLANDTAAGDVFGLSVSVSGDTAVIGARGKDENGTNSGSAYVFRFDGADWVQEAKLLPGDGAAGDLFGTSVSVSGDTAVIGAHRDTDNGMQSGSAYVYRFDGADWVQEAKLLPDDGGAGDEFGGSVSVSGETAVVGARFDDDNGSGSGSAYVFRFDGTNWVQEAKVLPADGAADQLFGQSVSTSDGRAAFGAPIDDDIEPDSGSAYVYDLGCTMDCLPDVNGDGVLTPADFTAWIAAFNAGDSACDQNGDGACTPADFTAWIANFNAGC